eukprot:15479889-Alexandrium_andersonii.AAC.1
MISTALANQASTALSHAYARRHAPHSGEPCLRRPRRAAHNAHTASRSEVFAMWTSKDITRSAS